MTDFLRPETPEEVAEAIRDAKAPINIEGGGGLKGLGRVAGDGGTLKTDRLKGVIEYSPTELYVTFAAGTTLTDAKATLAEKNQRLPFDPPDLTHLYGASGPATVGGVAASGLSGPSRVASGAVRDFLIGVKFVDGVGQAMHGGGRVMKNVTGYDLCKISAGAMGTLGVLTEVTFKVLPNSVAERTLAVQGLDDFAGQAAMSAALKTPFEPVSAAHLPASVAGRIQGLSHSSHTLIRFEGFPDSLDYRTEAIRRNLPVENIISFEGEVSAAIWEAVRDASPFHQQGDRSLWRISTSPTKGPALVEKLGDLGGEAFYDWAGGLIWLALPADLADAGATKIRSAVSTAGGHATLIRGSEAVRSTVDVFQPLDPVVMKLTKGLKDVFDPKGLLNPGRMYAEV
jgi:glycolate oxidase FAD binding subunit